MKRIDFYKEYYKITDRLFSDRIIRSAKDRDIAWAKGQHNTAKSERKVFIAVQYLSFLLSFLFLLTRNWMYCVFCLGIFMLIYFITDFSV